MDRRLAVLFLLSLFIVTLFAPAAVMGATDGKMKVNLGPRYQTSAMRYMRLGNDSPTSFGTAPKTTPKMVLGGAARDYADTVGATYYDYQHNTTGGRQVEHRNTLYIHFDWTQFNSPTAQDRDVGYQSYDLSACTDFDFGTSGVVGGAGYAGFVSLDVWYDTLFAVPAAHSKPVQPDYIPSAYWDFGYETGFPSPLGTFETDMPTDIYGWGVPGMHGVGNLPSAGNPNIWPKIDLQLGTEQVLHMVASESIPTGDTNTVQTTMSYYRRVGPYGKEAGVWSDQRVVDSNSYGDAVVVADPNSDKVALVWPGSAASRPKPDNTVAWIDNDIYYAISTNQGAEWVADPTTHDDDSSIGFMVEQGVYTGGNITNYPNVYDTVWKNYGEVQALFTTDGNLHIIWQTRLRLDDNSATWRDAAIWHWSTDNPEARLIYMAPRTLTTDSALCVYIPRFGGDVCRISLAECDGKLYASYVLFGIEGNNCGYRDLENKDPDYNRPLAQGYVFMSASEDGGYKWDPPLRVTDAPDRPDGCYADSTCQHEYFPSLARYGRTESCGTLTGTQVLDLLYVEDKAPGDALSDGIWTNNPLVWITTPCRELVKEPLYRDDAGQGYGEWYGDAPIRVVGDGDTSITLQMWNPGLLDNNYSITVGYAMGDGWVTPSPASGVIGCCSEDTVPVTLTFTAPTGAPDPSAWACTLKVASDAGLREIKAMMMVATDFIYPSAAVLSTTCKRIKLWNTAELVNDSANAALDYIDDCDTFNPYINSAIYLYDASPVICRLDGGDTLRFTMYSQSFIDSSALRPLTPLTVDESTYPDYAFATAELATADTTIGIIVEYYVPTASENCEFVLEKLKLWNRTATTIPGVLVGEFLDWDVPADSGSRNGSGFNETLNLIYQYGAEFDQDDSTEALCPQESDDRYGGFAIPETGSFVNMMTVDNPTYVYSGGRPNNPLDPSAVYDLMKNREGFTLYTSSNPDSQVTDLSTLVTFGEYDMAPDDTICVLKILSTSKTGLADLEQSIVDANAFIAAHQEIQCVLPCDCVPGNCNGDAVINVGDAVYLINYVFKSGLAPTPYAKCNGDANGDCVVNVGDAVFLINFVFKSGLTPVDCEYWRNKCGALQ